MTTKEIPVLLLTGYLGSGKTTLVNHILANKHYTLLRITYLIGLDDWRYQQICESNVLIPSV